MRVRIIFFRLIGGFEIVLLRGRLVEVMCGDRKC